MEVVVTRVCFRRTNKSLKSCFPLSIRREISISLCLITLVTVALLCGCSKSDSGLEMPEHGLSTTGVGAAAGAAFGGGVGAIIGSATGNAGEGLAIGAAGGAVAGAAIGSQFEKHEMLIAEQQETLTRQEERISEQNREIQELKQGMGEQGVDQGISDQEFSPPIDIEKPKQETNDHFEIPRQNAPSWKTDEQSPGYGGHPQAKPWGEKYSEDRAKEREEMRKQVRARMGAPATVDRTSIVEEPLEVPASSPVSAKLPPAAEQERASGLPPAKELSSTEEIVPEQTRLEAEPQPASLPQPDLPSGETQQVKAVGDDIKSPLATLPKDANCADAEKEAVRARNATSDADKLFYFRRALRLCPKEPTYHVEMGKVYGEIGRIDDARFEFNKALELDPENQLAQDELSMIMLNNNSNTY